MTQSLYFTQRSNTHGIRWKSGIFWLQAFKYHSMTKEIRGEINPCGFKRAVSTWTEVSKCYHCGGAVWVDTWTTEAQTFVWVSFILHICLPSFCSVHIGSEYNQVQDGWSDSVETRRRTWPRVSERRCQRRAVQTPMCQCDHQCTGRECLSSAVLITSPTITSSQTLTLWVNSLCLSFLVLLSAKSLC